MAIHTPSMRVVVDQRPVTIARVLPPRFGGLDIGRPFEIALALSLLTLSRYDVGTVSGLAAETLRLSRLIHAGPAHHATGASARLDAGEEFLARFSARSPHAQVRWRGISPLRDRAGIEPSRVSPSSPALEATLTGRLQGVRLPASLVR